MPQFKIVGNDLQYLIAELEPGEKVWANAGRLIWKSTTVKLNAVMRGGFLASLKRDLTGATAFVLEIEGPGTAALSSVVPGRILEVELNGSKALLAEAGSFLAAEQSVNYDVKFLVAELNARDNPFFIKFSGFGKVFLHTGPNVQELYLEPGMAVDIKHGHIVALDDGMPIKVVKVGGLKMTAEGGEGIFLLHVEGPGRVWIRI